MRYLILLIACLSFRCGSEAAPALVQGDLTICVNDGVCTPPLESSSCFDCQCTFTSTCNCNGRCDPGETRAGCHRDCPPACDIATMNQCTPRSYPLHPYCSPDVAAVCAHDIHCCATAWDITCVREIWSVAGSSVCGGVEVDLSQCTTPPSSCPGGTTDSYWFIGSPKVKSSGAETTKICNLDPYCCNVSWDTVCQGEWIWWFDDGSPGRLHQACGDGVCGGTIHTGSGDFPNIETANNCTYDCAR